MSSLREALMEGDKMERLSDILSEISESLKVLAGKNIQPEGSLLQENQTIKKRKCNDISTLSPHDADVPNKEESPIIQKEKGYLDPFHKRMLEKFKNSPSSIFSLADVPYFEAKHRLNPRNINLQDMLDRFQRFNKFDTVSDYSDHFYASQKMQPGLPDWVANITKEWKVVQEQLHDNILVRAYEGRPDLLRAVIIGPEGTPYHDGLFFFDLCFPKTYPSAPPRVHYLFEGLEINPSIYPNGSLSTAFPTRDENDLMLEFKTIWVPGTSNMLNFLIFLKDLFNATPILNGIEHGHPYAYNGLHIPFYNEVVFIKSIKTMVAVVNTPPKDFEEFVVGHFHNRANDILKAYKAYSEGVQVGCLVNGVPEGNKGTMSETFTKDLLESIQPLMDAFKIIGADNVDAGFNSTY